MELLAVRCVQTDCCVVGSRGGRRRLVLVHAALVPLALLCELGHSRCPYLSSPARGSLVILGPRLARNISVISYEDLEDLVTLAGEGYGFTDDPSIILAMLTRSKQYTRIRSRDRQYIINSHSRTRINSNSALGDSRPASNCL